MIVAVISAPFWILLAPVGIGVSAKYGNAKTAALVAVTAVAVLLLGAMFLTGDGR